MIMQGYFQINFHVFLLLKGENTLYKVAALAFTPLSRQANVYVIDSCSLISVHFNWSDPG